jgi:membrane-bound lytic murein transglycosylase F
VAHGITITSDRKEKVNFTDYLYLTHQVLVQRKPENWRQMKWSAIESELVHDAIELIGDTVSVRENSSYFRRLQNLSREIGGTIHIDTLPGHLSTDEIIKMVVDGKIKYTVADNNIANINASYYHILDIDVPISFSQRIAWAVHPGSPELLKEINLWLEDMKEEGDYYVIYNKYFKNRRNFRKRVQSDFYSLTNNRISQYDELIKENSETVGWDWRLVASQIYQESRFDPGASSWAGAGGLMQIMPSMAEDLGIENRMNPEQSIEGGTRYLKRLWDNFEAIEDSVQRIKFTLASYNCGYYHVLDARTLAEMNNLDPNRWDDNVEEMILELSYPDNYNKEGIKYGYVRGIEPYTYVRQIFERYDHYRKFIEV